MTIVPLILYHKLFQIEKIPTSKHISNLPNGLAQRPFIYRQTEAQKWEYGTGGWVFWKRVPLSGWLACSDTGCSVAETPNPFINVASQSLV